jgi:hypothetical protein
MPAVGEALEILGQPTATIEPGERVLVPPFVPTFAAAAYAP